MDEEWKAVCERTVAALRDEGYALVPGVLGPAQVRRLCAAIDGLQALHWDYEGLVDHYKCVFNRDPLWLPMLDLPGVIEPMEAMLGGDCHVIGQTAWRCHPGFIGADMHLDYLPMALPAACLAEPAFELPMFICTAQLYLSDIDETLCPTWVIPGSHKAGRAPAADEREWNGQVARPILCRAGDVLLLRSELWHAGSRNTSQRTRYLLQIHYGRRMVAQKFSPYLRWRFNPLVIDACTPRQRRLLGDHEAAEYD
ncbi:phytanoyl-CoA dioxygenase family protein [Pseudomonas sp. NY15181]|uniref:phytanoyl-CoA dioxygenase family protein n=1 Tax=Pseudomonas sp. NY15181 TaxID=3400349 RepID=UPI003A83DB82